MAIPPILAPIGIAIARAILPLPSTGMWRNTGAMKVSIIAAVAVLLMNIENNPVTRRNPRRTNSDFFPKSFSKAFASCTSTPIFDATAAMTKPPRNSMMVGSAKAYIRLLYEIIFTPSTFKNEILPLEHVNRSSTMTSTDDVHDGTASVTHIAKANANTAITLCSTTVMFVRP